MIRTPSRWSRALALTPLVLACAQQPKPVPPAAPRPSAQPAPSSAQPAAPSKVWPAELESEELARLAKLPGADAAVARRIYQRAGVDGAFEQRITVKPGDATLAEAAVAAEWVLALVPKGAPADARLLEALATDADEQVRDVASAALLITTPAPSRTPLDSDKALALAPLIGAGELVRHLPRPARADEAEPWLAASKAWELVHRYPELDSGAELVAFAESKPHPHFRTHAALALADIGDLRALPLFAERLKEDPQKLYAGGSDAERKIRMATDERVSIARMIADLAALNPEAGAKLKSESEDALFAWLAELPSPHANALRALVAVKSELIMRPLRGWAFPSGPLPASGQQPPLPEQWVVAQSALRYLGRARDAQSFKKLSEQLGRRPPKMDATMDGLLSGGNALLGMGLRAIGTGAAQGLAEWGDPRGLEPLLRYIDDPLNNEQARREACLAAVWIAPDAELPKLLDKALAGRTTPQDDFRALCLLSGFERRPRKNAALWTLLTGPDRTLGLSAARILGRAGLTKEEQTAALDRLPHDDKAHDRVALALLLGAEPEVATRAVAASRARPGKSMELKELWHSSFGELTLADLDSGRLFRSVDNAIAAGRELEFAGEQPWPTLLLARSLRDIVYDSGPGSLTKTSLRLHLLRKVEHGSALERRSALLTLGLMDERGVLLSLVRRSGGTPEAEDKRNAARQALRFVDGKLRPILAIPR